MWCYNIMMLQYMWVQYMLLQYKLRYNQDNGDGSDNGWAAATISAILLPGLLGSLILMIMIVLILTTMIILICHEMI